MEYPEERDLISPVLPGICADPCAWEQRGRRWERDGSTSAAWRRTPGKLWGALHAAWRARPLGGLMRRRAPALPRLLGSPGEPWVNWARGWGPPFWGKRTRSTWGTETGRDALTDAARGGHRQVLAATTAQNLPRDNIFPSRHPDRYAENLGLLCEHTGRRVRSRLDSGCRSHHQHSSISWDVELLDQ